MSEEQLAAIDNKLDQLIRLAAQYMSASCETKNECILLLGQAGLDRSMIAEICETSPNAVSVALSIAKKKAKG